jgi:hypothetical protein
MAKPCVQVPDPLLGNIRLNLLNALFVDDLTAQYAPGVSQAIALRSQLALCIVDSFAENYPYRVYLFAGDNDLQDLTAFHVNLYLFSIHWVSTLQLLIGDMGYMKRDTTGSVPDILKWCIGVESAVGLLAAQRRLPIATDSDYWTVCTRCGQCEIACQARDKGAKRMY